MLKRLIVNADDFGLSAGVNQAVERAWQEGILTQASIMAGGDAFEDAVDIARRNPGLQVGLHLTLVQGRPVLPPEQIPGLVGPDGNFPDNPVTSGIRIFFDRGLREQLMREIEAQICRARDAGIPISHIDGHLNIQMHPTVFQILAELMPRYGITSFRITRERLRHNLAHDKGRVAGKSIEAFIFGALSNQAAPPLARLGIITADEVKGLLNSGRMAEAYILSILPGIVNGLTEIYFHPGILPDHQITARMPDYLHEEELAAILSPAVAETIKRIGITLCNYRGDIKTYA